MSLDVAIQSVVFYVLSCSTCAKINHRRKAKIQAKKDRIEKEKFESEQPGLYRHPSPFSTNPYWTEEIMMGPGPPKKNGDKDKSCSKNTSQQALNSAGQESSYAGSTAMSSEPPSSSPTAVTEGSRISGDGWNRKRYQREDEALWGMDIQRPGQRIMDAIAKAGSSASRLLESRLSRSGDGLREEGSSSPYFMARNPPVNDLHPPVVSTQPTSRDQTRWMLQPPPSAKIMEGKERVNRSRAGSNSSSQRGADEPPLSRQLTGKLVDAKLQRGESPSVEGNSTPIRRSRTTTSRKPRGRGQLHSRERSSSVDSDSSVDGTLRRKRRPQPLSIPSSAKSAIATLEYPTPAVLAGSEMRRTVKESSLPVTSSSPNSASPPVKEHDPLQEISNLSTSNTPKLRPQSGSRQNSSTSNPVPASTASTVSKFPGAETYRFPRPASIENAEPQT